MKMDSSFCKIYYSFYNNINTNILYLFFKSFFRIFDYRKYISLEILQNKPGLKTLFKLNDNICTTELSIAGAFFINNLWDSYVKRFSAKRLIKCFSDNFNKEDAYLYNTLYDYKTVSAFVPLFFLIDIKNTEIYSRFSNYVYLNLDISFNDDIMHGNSDHYARNKDIFIFDEKEFKAALQTSSTKHELEIIPTEKNKIFNPEQKIIAIWHNSFITIKRGGGVSIPGLVVEYKFADSLK